MAKAGSTTSSAFEQYTGEVYGWAFRVLGRHHDALDVVQDVFLRWHAQCARESPTEPRGWLRRVTLNRAIDLLRQRRSVTQPADEGGGVRVAAALSRHAPAAADQPPLAPLEQEELRREIALALDELTDNQKCILVAKVYDEMTFAQIADELGIAVPTVKTHYLRAVRAVRERLHGHWA